MGSWEERELEASQSCGSRGTVRCYDSYVGLRCQPFYAPETFKAAHSL